MEQTQMVVESVAYRGRGLARVEGRVVFLDGVLPGETVRAQITRCHKNCAEAEVCEIVCESAARIKPACGLASDCPGCCYQHSDYEMEVSLKQQQLENLLERIGGVSGARCKALIPSPEPVGYRNKIQVHAGTAAGNPVLGYYAKDNETVIDVRRCALAVDPINDLLAELRKPSGEIGLRPGSGANLRHTHADGAVFWTDGFRPPVRFITERTVFGDMRVPLKSFFQVNSRAADLLFKAVEALIGEIGPESVVDAYCGVGVLSIAAAKGGADNVLGIDRDGRAVHAARFNVDFLGLGAVRFLEGSMEKELSEAFRSVALSRTAVILDPTRRGLATEVVEALNEAKPSDLVYVSCAADTMARDIKMLSTSGYELRSLQLIDMFPRTPYFESVAHLAQQ